LDGGYYIFQHYEVKKYEPVAFMKSRKLHK